MDVDAALNIKTALRSLIVNKSYFLPNIPR